jgi:hypothetical protein
MSVKLCYPVLSSAIPASKQPTEVLFYAAKCCVMSLGMFENPFKKMLFVDDFMKRSPGHCKGQHEALQGGFGVGIKRAEFCQSVLHTPRSLISFKLTPAVCA